MTKALTILITLGLLVLVWWGTKQVENIPTNGHTWIYSNEIAPKQTEEPQVETERSVVAREEPRTIYEKANVRFPAVPAQILEAIHQVETGKSGDTAKKSWAGAVGPMQFMPSTWAKYGIDGNDDGRVEITSKEDSIISAANYLNSNIQEGHTLRGAIWLYNHADWYVEKVIRVAKEIGWKE